MILTLTWIIFWLPFLMAILLGYGLPKSSKLAGVLGTAAMFTAFLLSCALLPQYDALKHQGQTLLESSLPWIHVGNLTLDFGIYVNGLTLLMLLVVTGIGTLVFLFSTSYMAGDPGYNRYFACLSLFSFSMLGIVLANILLQIFIFWELVGLSSYLLIGFWYEKTEASTAGKKAFMTTRVGDVGMMLGILGLYGFMASKGVESFNFTVIASHLSSLGISSFWMTLITLGLFLGAVGKSAQVPLHVWLPDAMEGPTPVSALIHAATMVAAGIFMVVRLYFIFEVSPETLRIIAWTGGITAFLAATLALVQTDIKKVLAYSTLSQLGYMVLALGLASPEAGMFHLTTHAFFKALLFLGAGSLIHALHTQDIREMAGKIREEGGRFQLFKKMPWTSLTFLIGTLALIGIPPLSGFYSKEEILTAASHGPKILFVLSIATVFLTAFYNGRLFTIVFLPASRNSGHSSAAHGHGIHESDFRMLLPLLILAVLTVIGGFLPIRELLNFPSTAEHAVPHGFGTLAMISIATAAAGFLMAVILYVSRSKSLRSAVPFLAAPASVLERKYFFDEAYDLLIQKVQNGLGRLADLLERYLLVEWTLNGLGRLIRTMSDTMRRLQTGVVQFYAFVFTIGVTVIIYFFVVAKI